MVPELPRSLARAIPTKRVLLFAFAGVVASFVAATGYAQHRAAAIDALALELAERTSQSIDHLRTARTGIGELQKVVASLVEGTGRAAEARRVASDRVDVASDAPEAPPASAEDSTRELDRAMDDLRAAARSGPEDTPGTLRNGAAIGHLEEVIRSADHAFDVVLAAIQADDEHARRAAQQIRVIRKRSQVTAFALDSVCAAFAVLAFGLAFASHRTHTELLQRRNDELEQFAGRVAHDILSPLTSVRLALDRQLRARGDAPVDEMIVRASRSLSRVQLIIDGLLMFAKAGAEANPDARCDVGEVVSDVVTAARPTADAAGIALHVQAAPGLAVACSSGVLMSVASNLVNNAVKYIGTPANPRIDVRVTARDGVVRIEVEDNGSGMPDDVVPTIFEPYVRGRHLHQTGIGLGLATVKRLAQAHKGKVGVESAVGRGSRFWVELPRTSCTEERASEIPARGAAKASQPQLPPT